MAVLSRTALNAPESYEAWLSVYVGLVDTAPDPRTHACPNCGHFEVRYRFVAEPSSRIGFCLLWCEQCHHGATISRVKVPPGMALLNISEPPEALADGIPDIEQAQPTAERPGAGDEPLSAAGDWLRTRLAELEPAVAEYERLAVLLDDRTRSAALTPRSSRSVRRD